MKKKYTMGIGVLCIVLVTVLLVVLLPGGSSDKKEENTEEPGTTVSERKTEAPVTTEQITAAKTELVIEKPVVTESPTVIASTEQEEEPELPSGAGEHKGKLGSSFVIPEGFLDLSPKKTEEGYHYVFEDPDLEMRVQISEYHEEEMPTSFRMQYTVYQNLYENDNGSRITEDSLEEREYVLAGYTNQESTAFYLKGMAMLDRNIVQFSVRYPAGDREQECKAILQEILDSYEYHFLPNPDRPTEETTIPDWAEDMMRRDGENEGQ